MPALLAQKLTERLQKTLPGEVAHRQMATAGRIEQARQIPSNHRLSAVLILLYPAHNSWCLPLIKRPEYDGVHSGQMAFPGGKKEAQDPSLIYTALRETAEEIGVYVGHDQVVGCLSDLYIPPSNMLVSPVVAIAHEKPTYLLDPSEVAKVVDIRIDDLLNPRFKENRTLTVMNNFQLQAPTYQLEGETIWGATAMMLSELVHIWQEINS